MIFLASLFFIGVINRVRSLSSGRKGPGIIQNMWDILRLFRKSSIYSRDTSFVFQIAPTIYFSSIVCAIFVLPFDLEKGLLSFEGDIIFFAYILALGKFFMIISALDVGSSFEGMGANREALFSLLVEPAFFILIGSLAMLTGFTSFHEIFANLHFDSSVSIFIGVLATYILVQIALIENSRLPVDDPKTHLELTMIHEVMILDNSGFDLGLIQYGTSLKFAMYGALIFNFFTPLGAPLIVQIVIFFVVQILFASFVGIFESFRARARMKHNPQVIFILTSISILVFFGVLIIMNKFSI